MCGRFRPGDGFNGNGPIIKVDVATGLELIGIFDVVFRPGDQDFLISPQIFNIVGKLPHQNIKAVGILDPGFIIRLAFLVELEQEMSNGAITASASNFFIIPGVHVVLSLCHVAGQRR